MTQEYPSIVNPSQLIGVMDWLQGVAVHAVAGRRESYRPLNCGPIQAGNIEQLLHHYLQLGIRSFYIADLDAITQEASQSQQAYHSLCCCLANFASLTAECGAAEPIAIWLDAGTCRQSWEWLQAALAANIQIPNIQSHRVLGTESLSDLDSLDRFVALAGVDPLTNESRLAISIDLRDGQLVGRTLLDSFECLWKLGQRGADIGIRDWILLDIATVGTERGPSLLPLCQRWIERYPQTRLISGGGVRNWSDVQSFLALGCNQVLAATWLHNLTINHPNGTTNTPFERV